MIPEAHGETCRLGYLKVVAALKEQGLPNLTAISGKLLDFARSLEGFRKAPKPPGLLTKSRQTAFYYAVLARELGILNEYLPMISALPSYEKVRALVREFLSNGMAPEAHEAIVTPSLGEKVVLAYILSRRDPLFVELMRWAKNAKQFKRMQAIEHGLKDIMPRIWPDAAEKFRKYSEELEASSPAEAIRSRAYNAGRHLISPRLEWAVDLGLLRRYVGGGAGARANSYEAAPLLDRILPALEGLGAVPLDAPCDGETIRLFDQLVSAYAGEGRRCISARPKAVEEALRDAHAILSKAGPVPILALLVAASARLLDAGLAAAVAEAKEVLTRMIFVNMTPYYRPLPSGSIAIESLDPPPCYVTPY